jgi:hypothetical protein
LFLFASKDAESCHGKESDLESCRENSATIHGANSLAGQTCIDHARLSIPKRTYGRVGVWACRRVGALTS